MTNIILVFVARFREVLLGRLARALALKEETEVSPAEWLNAEAKKRQALQEGGHSAVKTPVFTVIPPDVAFQANTLLSCFYRQPKIIVFCVVFSEIGC